MTNDPELDQARAELRAAMRRYESVDSGWLIERGDSDTSEPKYWAAGQREAERSSAWTSNHMQAIRFTRKIDAERVAERIMKGIDVRIREHGWS